MRNCAATLAVGFLALLTSVAGCRGAARIDRPPSHLCRPGTDDCAPGQACCTAAATPCPECTELTLGTCVRDCLAASCSANGTGDCPGCCPGPGQRCSLPEGVCIPASRCAHDDDCLYPALVCDPQSYACVPAACAAYADDPTTCQAAGCALAADGACVGAAPIFADCNACPADTWCSQAGACIPVQRCAVNADCPTGMLCDSVYLCEVDTTCDSGEPLGASWAPPNMVIAFDRSGSMSTTDCDGRTRLACAQEALQAVVTEYAVDSSQVFFGLARFEPDLCASYSADETGATCVANGCLWLPSTCPGEAGLCTGNSGANIECRVAGPIAADGGALPDVPAGPGSATARQVIATMSGCGVFDGDPAACAEALGCTYAGTTCSGLQATTAAGYTPTAQTMQNIYVAPDRYGLPLACDYTTRANYVTLSTDGDANCCGCYDEGCTAGSDTANCLGQANAFRDVSYWLVKMRGLPQPIETFVVGFQAGVLPYKLNTNAVAGGVPRAGQCPDGTAAGCATTCAAHATPEACNATALCHWQMAATGGSCGCRAVTTPCSICNPGGVGDPSCCLAAGGACTWNGTVCEGAGNSDFNCRSYTPTCAFFTDPAVCAAAGCSWSGGACSQCSDHSGSGRSAECQAAPGCTWSGCTDAGLQNNQTACTSAGYGCTWTGCSVENGDAAGCALLTGCTWTGCTAASMQDNRTACLSSGFGCTWAGCSTEHGDELGCTGIAGCTWTDCTDLNQSSCSGSYGCTWTGCSSENGDSSGCAALTVCTWTPCASLAQASCTGSVGCAWSGCSTEQGDPTGCAGIGGCTWTPCASLVQASCTGSVGCAWSGCSTEQGDPTGCAGIGGCTWTPCADLAQASCTSPTGCTWSGCSSHHRNESACTADTACAWTACAALAQGDCSSTYGCSWIDNACVGATGGRCSGTGSCSGAGGSCTGTAGACTGAGGTCAGTAGTCAGTGGSCSGTGVCSGAGGRCAGSVGTCSGTGGGCSGTAGTCTGAGGACAGATCTQTGSCGREYCLAHPVCQWLGRCSDITDATACEGDGSTGCTWDEGAQQCSGAGTPQCTYRYCYYPVADADSFVAAYADITESIAACNLELTSTPEDPALLQVYFDVCAPYDGFQAGCTDPACTWHDCNEIPDEAGCALASSCTWSGACAGPVGAGECASALTTETTLPLPAGGADGWTYDPLLNRITLTGECCDALRNGANGRCTAFTDRIAVRPLVVEGCPGDM
jgi:hypothetical protein